MALVACKECGKEISKKAETCPHCGFKPKKTSLFSWIVTILIAIPVLLGIVISAGKSNSSSSVATKSPQELAAERQRSLDSNRESYARIIGKRAITKQLKAPATADFSGFTDTQVAHLKDGGPNKWIVKGYVDAQNSFGAKLRNNYQVVIEFEEGKYDSSRVLTAELY
jgi:hypothetical protein